jgi:hypothetical protein
MESFLDLTTEAKCRELLDRYPDNLFVKDRLASLLRSQGRNDEAPELLPVEPPHAQPTLSWPPRRISGLPSRLVDRPSENRRFRFSRNQE